MSLFAATLSGIRSGIEPDDDAPTEPDLSLHEFLIEAWPYIDPAEYVDSWFAQAICEHLEAVSKGQIRNLIICQPPRTGKSNTTSVMFPAWEWTYRPKTRFMFASYASELSTDHSVKTRRLIKTPWYQSLWGHRFRVLSDKDKITVFENDHGGSRQATSVTGAATGFGADIIVYDDVMDPNRADSDVVRVATNNWYKETMGSRRNDLKTGREIIIQQRLHENDLVGFAQLEQPGRYEILSIPMEYEPFRDHTGVELPKPATVLGFSDPRNNEGQLLHPKRIGRDEVEEMKVRLGEYGYAAQCQQRPAPRGGGMFKRIWFEGENKNHIVAKAPVFTVKVRYWDKAASTEKRSARTAGVLMGRDPVTGIYYIEDAVFGRWGVEERDQIMKETAQKDGVGVGIWEEQEPGSGGKESAQATIRLLIGYSVQVDRVTGDKTVRARPLATAAGAGMIRMVLNPDWNEEFLRETETFPYGRYKDLIDASGGAFNKLAVATVGSGATAGKRPVLATSPHAGLSSVARILSEYDLRRRGGVE